MNGGDDKTRTRDLCRDRSGLQVLLMTWKSTDGTVSHWKYTKGDAIVYRDVYRATPGVMRGQSVSSELPTAIADRPCGMADKNHAK
jgi:hypothetical protein